MDIVIKALDKKDHKKAMAFAEKGMHFDFYSDSKIILKLYSKYFWNLEITGATRIIAAYSDNKLVGVLLADIYGENKAYKAPLKTLYVKLVDLFQSTFLKGGSDVYNNANEKMLANYKKNNNPDGEIRFLAADPDIPSKGIGTMLINELEKNAKGKLIYLFTDDQCNYHFYDKRGFIRAGEEDIVMTIAEKSVPLKCMLFSKQF